MTSSATQSSGTDILTASVDSAFYPPWDQ